RKPACNQQRPVAAHSQAVQQHLPIATSGQGGPDPNSKEAQMATAFTRDEFANAYAPGPAGTFDPSHPQAGTPTTSAEAATTDLAHTLRERSHNTLSQAEAATQARQP